MALGSGRKKGKRRKDLQRVQENEVRGWKMLLSFLRFFLFIEL